MSMGRKGLISLLCAAGLASSCGSDSPGHFPAMPVAISLADPGLWNTYGVAALGQTRSFIKPLRQPSGFAYTDATYTGLGGVLLICGIDGLSGQTGVPLAYDLSCPVECSADVRVAVDPATFEAICPKCHSHYNVYDAAGATISGKAAEEHIRGSRRYSCRPATTGGYIITQ